MEGETDPVVRLKRPHDWVGYSKLTVQQVQHIKLEFADPSHSISEMSRRYGVSQVMLYRIRNGQSWAQVKPDPPRQEVVDEADLPKRLLFGWTLQAVLPSGKIVLNRPEDKP